MTNLPDRFWAKVDKTGECWLWTATTSRGYGRFKVAGRSFSAHRLAFEDAGGQIPAGLELDHLCRVRHCVNPDHLEVVTGRENIRRGISPVAANLNKTSCIHGHEYTPENTYTQGGRRRMCRTCGRDAQRRYQARKAAA